MYFKRLITGRTQVPGLRVLIENDPIAWIFATDSFKWVFTWLGSMNLIALRTDGTPLATGIPPSVIWFIALAILTTWILMKTRYGNWIFASGGDKNGANNVGVPVGRVKYCKNRGDYSITRKTSALWRGSRYKDPFTRHY